VNPLEISVLFQFAERERRAVVVIEQSDAVSELNARSAVADAFFIEEGEHDGESGRRPHAEGEIRHSAAQNTRGRSQGERQSQLPTAVMRYVHLRSLSSVCYTPFSY
jgi:hypothetical protein